MSRLQIGADARRRISKQILVISPRLAQLALGRQTLGSVASGMSTPPGPQSESLALAPAAGAAHSSLGAAPTP